MVIISKIYNTNLRNANSLNTFDTPSKMLIN